MGLKESLKKLQEDEKIDVKREVKKALTKIKNEKTRKHMCIMCQDEAKYSIKGSSDWYCKDCAIEYFGELKYLKRASQTPKEKKIMFITGSIHKFSEVQKIIGDRLEHQDIDLVEIQDINPRKIIEAKILEAKKHYSGELIVEDTSVYLNCLNGLPGPLIKWFMKTIGSKGLYDIAKKSSDNTAYAKTIIGYSDKKGKILFFEGIVEGEIVKPVNIEAFGWDNIFMPEDYDETFAEMTKEEKNKISMRAIAAKKLKKYLEDKELG